MTAVNIAFADPGSDLLAYLDDWIGPPPPITTYGEFNTADTQWAGGDEPGRPTNAVVLDGSDFAYPEFGGFTGTVNTLTFGDGLSGTAAGNNFSIDDVQLTLGLGGVAADTTFNYAIYGLQTGDVTYLYDYFDAVGTVQHSTTGNDTLYGFAATDTFVFTGTDGSDIIEGFDVAHDFINISSWGAPTLGDLSISWAYDSGTSLYDATITYNGNGNSISVQDIALSSLNSSNVLV